MVGGGDALLSIKLYTISSGLPCYSEIKSRTHKFMSKCKKKVILPNEKLTEKTLVTI